MKKLNRIILSGLCLLLLVGCSSQSKDKQIPQGAYVTGSDHGNTFTLLFHPEYPDSVVLSGVNFTYGATYDYLLTYRYYPDKQHLILYIPPAARNDFSRRGSQVDNEVYLEFSPDQEVLACFSDCPKGLPFALRRMENNEDGHFKENYKQLRRQIDPHWNA